MRKLARLVLFAIGLVACDNVGDVDFGSLPAAASATPTTGACGGAPWALAQIENVLPSPFLLDNGFIYVVSTATVGDLQHETLWQISKAGHSVAIATNQSQIGGIDHEDESAIDPEGAILWSTNTTSADAGPSGAIWKWTAAGASVLIPSRPAPGPMLVFGANVLWAEQGAIMTAATSGSDVSMLQEIAPGEVPTAFTLFDPGGLGLVWTTADPQSVDPTSARVVEAPLPFPFGLTTEIAGPDSGGAAAVETPGLYDRIIYSGLAGIVAVTPPGPPTTLVSLGGFVDRIADDGIDVYFIDPSTHNLMAYPDSPGGGGSDESAGRVVAGPIDPKSSFGVDYACAYWVDVDAGTLTMVQK